MLGLAAAAHVVGVPEGAFHHELISLQRPTGAGKLMLEWGDVGRVDWGSDRARNRVVDWSQKGASPVLMTHDIS